MELKDKIEITTKFLDESQIMSKTGSWSWNVLTNEVVWSKNMFRILGLEPKELEPSYELAFHHVYEADKKRYEETLMKAIENKTTYYFQYRIQQKDLSVISVVSTGKCILDKNKKLVRMIGVVQDISIQKELEKIKKEKERIEDREKVKSLILQIIAHDIKNPFNHINGFSGLLVENIQEKKFEEVATYGQIIKDATGSVLKVLDGLLQWAFSGKDIRLYKPEMLLLKNLVEQVIEFVSVFSEHKVLKIINSIPSETLVFADKHMLSTSLRNLISNSIKFCSNNGEITVEMQQVNKKTQISVSDTGVGIPEKTLKTLFDTNQLVSTNGINGGKGAGLGLQICKAIIERHNGEIWIESVINKGTTCHFTLPEKQEI